MSLKNDSAHPRLLPLALGVLAAFTLTVNAAQAGNDAGDRSEIAKRIAPVGQVNVAGAEPAPAPAAAAAPAPAAAAAPEVASVPAAAVEAASSAVDSAMGAAASMVEAVMPAAAPAADSGKGKAIYDGTCFACHTTGAANAPKLGDAAAWGPRIAQGKDVLYKHALEGKPGTAMPPKGGRMDLADADVKAAVDYMVSQAK